MQYRPISQAAARRPHVPKHIPPAPTLAPLAVKRASALQRLVDEANLDTQQQVVRAVPMRALWAIEAVSVHGYQTLFLGEAVACIAYMRGMLDWRGTRGSR